MQLCGLVAHVYPVADLPFIPSALHLWNVCILEGFFNFVKVNKLYYFSNVLLLELLVLSLFFGQTRYLSCRDFCCVCFLLVDAPNNNCLVRKPSAPQTI